MVTFTLGFSDHSDTNLIWGLTFTGRASVLGWANALATNSSRIAWKYSPIFAWIFYLIKQGIQIIYWYSQKIDRLIQLFDLNWPNNRDLKIPGRDELGRLPEVNLISQACARELRLIPLVPRTHDPSVLQQGSTALALSNNGSPRFTDFPPNLANLIGWEYETNILRLLRKSAMARTFNCGLWGRECSTPSSSHRGRHFARLSVL